MIHSVAELVSLLLTVPAIILAFLVCKHFLPKGAKVLFGKRFSDLTEVDLLIAGIAVSFLGSAMDNLYWGAAWSASYLNLPFKDALFASGVYSNIPFRQVTGILAAVLHLWALYKVRERISIFWRVLIATVSVTGALIYSRHYLM